MASLLFFSSLLFCFISDFLPCLCFRLLTSFHSVIFILFFFIPFLSSYLIFLPFSLFPCSTYFANSFRSVLYLFIPVFYFLSFILFYIFPYYVSEFSSFPLFFTFPLLRFSRRYLCPQARRRLWSVSLLSVAVLTACNVFLTVRLLHSGDCPSAVAPAPAPAPAPEELAHKVVDVEHCSPPPLRDLRLARWDARRLFQLVDSLVVGDRFAELSGKFSVCLATQSSMERLSSLVQVRTGLLLIHP